MFTRDQLKRAATLTEKDYVQLGRCRALMTGLGLPIRSDSSGSSIASRSQQPFELFEELVCFSAARWGLDPGLIELYRKRQPTISEHQQTITAYLRLRPFDDAAAVQLQKRKNCIQRCLIIEGRPPR
jgi:hypothetical protein